MSAPDPVPQSSLILYQTEDGRTRLEVRLQNETVWLSLNQMADLFQRDKSVISRHIKNVFEEDELVRNSVVAEYATTAADGKSLPGRVLRPRCHHLRRLPGEEPPRHPIPVFLGHQPTRNKLLPVECNSNPRNLIPLS